MSKTNFVDGDPSQGILGTVVPADFLNAVNKHYHTGLDQDGHGALPYAADTGTANAYVVALSPALTQYVTGMPVFFKAANDNTGASTININGLGTKIIVKDAGINLVSGDIQAGRLVGVVFDGSYMQLVGPPYNTSKLWDGTTGRSASQSAVGNTIPVRDADGSLFFSLYSMIVGWFSKDWLTTALVGTGTSVVGGGSLHQATTGAANDLVRDFNNDAFFLPFISAKRHIVDWSLFAVGSVASVERHCRRSAINTAPADTDKHFGFKIIGSRIWATNGNGTTATTTDTGADIGTGIQLTTLRSVFVPGVDVKFYVNGVLKAQHTTNLPAGGDLNITNHIVFQTKTTAAAVQYTYWGRVLCEQEY